MNDVKAINITSKRGPEQWLNSMLKQRGVISEKDAEVRAVRVGVRPPKRPVMTYLPPTNAGPDKQSQYHESEYDMINPGTLEDIDGYIYQGNLKKLALGIKEGWGLVGKNTQTVSYIKKRFSQLETAQNQTMISLFNEILATLLRWHNCYIIKVRDVDASGGKVRTEGNKRLKPVAAYFAASPNTIETKINKSYKVTGYKHKMPDGRSIFLKPENVVHIHIFRKPHFLTAAPPTLPITDDVSALRRIEEHVENLVYQHIYPLYQYKIGTKEFPDVQRAEDGYTEIELVEKKLRNAPTDSMLVTPFRHEIKGLGAESRALRADSFLEYFRRRVILGTSLSEVDFGFGSTANRATSEVMSKLAIGIVKYYQLMMADAINFHLIRELLLESTFTFDVLSEESIVGVEFNEIDLEAQIKKQNHYMLLYQGNLISFTEARNGAGIDALPESEEQEMFQERVKTPEIETAANAAAKARQQPENQHGTKTGPSGRKSSYSGLTFHDYISEDIYSDLSHDLHNLNKNYVNLSFVRQLFYATRDRLISTLSPIINSEVIRGTRGFRITESLASRMQAISNNINRQTEEDIERLIRHAMVKTSSELAVGERDQLSIDVLRYRTRFIERSRRHQAYILAKMAAFDSSGIEEVVITCDPGGEHYNIWNNTVIGVRSPDLELLPFSRANCQCDIQPLRRALDA